MTERSSIERRLKELHTSSAWSEPRIIDGADMEEIGELLDSGQITKVYDTREIIQDNLVELEHPDLYMNDREKAKLMSNDEIKKRSIGRWVLFPWLSELVRYPNPDDYYDLRTYRFRDLVTEEQQKELHAPRISVSGLSVGSNITELLTRVGIGSAMVMSDRKRPKISNIGRARLDMRDTLDEKIDSNAKKLSVLDPFIEQVHIREGITESSLAKLERAKPDIIVDEVDDMSSSALLRNFARELRLPYVSVSDIHDRAMLEICRYDYDPDTPLYASRVPDKVADRLLSGETTKKEETDIFAKSIGGYHVLTPSLIESSVRINDTLSGIPQLGDTAFMAAALATKAIRQILLGKKADTGLYSLKSPVRNRDTVGDWVRAAQTVADFRKQK